MSEKTNDTQELRKQLDGDITYHSSACNEHARYGVYAIMATALAFLIGEKGKSGAFEYDAVILGVILLLGFVYLFMESARYYMTAQKARSCRKELGTISNSAIIEQMQKHSDWTYKVWTVQLILCMILSLLMGGYLFYVYILKLI
jgi:hypothetical protein